MAPNKKLMVKGTVIDPGALAVKQKNKGRLMVRRLATRLAFTPPKQPVFLKVYKSKQLFKEAQIACKRLDPAWIGIACFRNTDSISTIGAADNTGRIHFGAIQQLIPDRKYRLTLPNVLIEIPTKCVKTIASKERVGTMAIIKGVKAKDKIRGMVTRSKSKIGVKKIVRVASAVGTRTQSTSEGIMTRSKKKIGDLDLLEASTSKDTKKIMATKKRQKNGDKGVSPEQSNPKETRREPGTKRKITSKDTKKIMATKKHQKNGDKDVPPEQSNLKETRREPGTTRKITSKDTNKIMPTKKPQKIESVPQDYPTLNSEKSNPSDDSLDFHENKELIPDMSCSSYLSANQNMPQTVIKPIRISSNNPYNRSLCLPTPSLHLPMKSQEKDPISNFNYRAPPGPIPGTSTRGSDEVDLENYKSLFSSSSADTLTIKTKRSSSNISSESSCETIGFSESEVDEESVDSDRDTIWIESNLTESETIGFVSTEEEDTESADPDRDTIWLESNLTESETIGFVSTEEEEDLESDYPDRNTIWTESNLTESESIGASASTEEDLESDDPYRDPIGTASNLTESESIGASASREEDLESDDSDSDHTVWIESNIAYYENMDFFKPRPETAEQKEKREQQEIIDRFIKSIVNMKFW